MIEDYIVRQIFLFRTTIYIVISHSTINQHSSRKVKVAGKVDITHMWTSLSSCILNLNPECRFTMRNHIQVWQYTGCACSECKVKAKAEVALFQGLFSTNTSPLPLYFDKNRDNLHLDVNAQNGEVGLREGVKWYRPKIF